MLAWSVRRRVFYFLVVLLVVIIGAALLWWWLKPLPSCFDQAQNQNELGVDCGGVCQAVCLSEVKPLKIIWTRILEVAPGRYDSATLVVNPNRQHGANRFHYLLRLLDSQGVLITTRRGETFINPGENYVVYDSHLNVGQRVPTQALFEIDEPPVWQRSAALPAPLKLATKSFVNEPSPRLIAEVTNPSLTDISNLTVVVVLSDDAGNAVAISSTLVDFLPQRGSTEIAFTWPQPLSVTTPVFEFYPHYLLPLVAP